MSSISAQPIEKGTPIVKGIVQSQSKYGLVIEKGRRAGKARPPKGELLRWIELKMGVDAAEAKRIEFVIRRSIGKKGFPGKHMFEKTWESTFPVIQRMFEAAGFNIARTLNR